jgi:hypothetical protein
MELSSNNEFKKYQNIRAIAVRLVEHIRDTQAEDDDTIDDIIDLAGAIGSQDMAGFATKIGLDNAVKELRGEINALPDKMTIRFGLMIIGTLGVIKSTQMLGWW